MENENLKRMQRIAKLMNITVANGATQGEEDNAKALATQMMADYNISQAEVLKAQGTTNAPREKCRLVVVDTIKFGAWQATTHALAGPIAQFCDCEYWFMKGQQTYTFFGLPNDALSAGYLFEALGAQIVEACTKFKDTEEYAMERHNGINHQTVMSSFLRGAEGELGRRLYSMWKDKNAIVEKATGTSLVVVKNDIVKADFKDTGIKLVNGGETYRTPGSSNAHKAGRDAASKMHIGTGIGHSAPDKRIGKD